MLHFSAPIVGGQTDANSVVGRAGACYPSASTVHSLKMAHLVEAQLKRFQLEPEAFDLAKQIYRQIQVKTAPGSGHELGAGAIGVPAISAYLACTQCVRADFHATLTLRLTRLCF